MTWDTKGRGQADKMEFGGEVLESDNRPPVGSMREKLALAVIARLVEKMHRYGFGGAHESQEAHVKYIWDTDDGLVRGRVLADTWAMLEAMLDVSEAVLHEGILADSGAANTAGAWEAMIRAIKEGK